MNMIDYTESKEFFSKKTKTEVVESISTLLEKLRHKDEFKARLPRDVSIGFGRHSGLFVGAYPDSASPFKVSLVTGDTYEEVEATIAEKLDLKLEEE